MVFILYIFLNNCDINSFFFIEFKKMFKFSRCFNNSKTVDYIFENLGSYKNFVDSFSNQMFTETPIGFFCTIKCQKFQIFDQ